MQKQIYHVEGCRVPQVGDIDGDQVTTKVEWGQQVSNHPYNGDTYEMTVTTEHFCDTCSQRNRDSNPCLGMLAFGYKWHNTPVGAESDVAGAEFIIPKNPSECPWYSFLVD